MGCWFHTMYTGGTGRSQVSLDVVQEFLGLVDLGGQVRRAAAVRVVQQHHLVFVSFHLVSHQHHVRGRGGGGGGVSVPIGSDSGSHWEQTKRTFSKVCPSRYLFVS